MRGGHEKLRPSPDINWAKNTYDPKTGDLISREPGVVRVGIGQTIYFLQETEITSPIVVKRTIDTQRTDTRVYLGFLGSIPSMSVHTTSEKPFTLEDPDRINRAAGCVIKLAEVEKSYGVFLHIQQVGTDYLHDLRLLMPETDRGALANIAVLEEAIGTYTQRDYTSEFLGLAETMEALGIAEARIAPFNGSVFKNGSSFTPDYIRTAYGQKEQIA